MAADNRKIQRVPPLLLEVEKNREDYYPKVVSIGPYHRDNQNLALVQAFKPTAVDLFLLDSPADKTQQFYNAKVQEIIGDVRRCYDQESMVGLLDGDLTTMMLRDACFIILVMEVSIMDVVTEAPPDPFMIRKAQALTVQFDNLTLSIFRRDLLLLENQIPLGVINLLITLKRGVGEDIRLLHRYMSLVIYGETRQNRIFAWTQALRILTQPLHLVEALHQLVTPNCVEETRCQCLDCRWLCCFNGNAAGHARRSLTCCSCTFLCCSVDPLDPASGNANAQGFVVRFVKFLTCNKVGGANARRKESMKFHSNSFRTLTDLKAKGIHFRPSPTGSLKDVNFKKGLFRATLELPEWVVSIHTKGLLLNLVAYELSPNNPHASEVKSYIYLMKSLVQSPEDVKELRKRRIFCNMLGSDEEVLNVYKDIETYGIINRHLFKHVKEQIQARYSR